jgi:pimeloyl-ACP methyl ester carboxylesterase
VAEDLVIERDGVGLACQRFGEPGPAVLLLHGLAGYGGEWAGVAAWLSEEGHCVVALDARGHGGSERRPREVSLAAHVADAAWVIEQLGLAPCVVIGQSLGGLVGILLAAEHPHAVEGLVVVEGGPDAVGAEVIRKVTESLSSWPVPFASRAAAVEYFQGRSMDGEVWAGGLERRDDGLWPRFDLDVLERTLREAPPGSYGAAWQGIRCPTLIVRASDGVLDPAYVREEMLDRLAASRLVEIDGGGHDVHLSRPAEFRDALKGFLAEVWERR